MKKIIFIGSLTLLTLAASGASEGWSRRSIRVNVSCVEEHKAALVYAYESTLKTETIRPELNVSVQFKITAEGYVEDVGVLTIHGFDAAVGNAAFPAIFADKIIAAAYTWRFPPVAVGDTLVEIPFLLVPVDGEGKVIAGGEKPINGTEDYYGRIVERDGKEVYKTKELVVDCRRERPIPFEIRRAIPDGDIFARAAKGETEKPAQGFLKDVGKYYGKSHNPPAARRNKKLASRERELSDVEAPLAEEELRAAVADLGLAEGYEWGVEKRNVKKAAKLRKKQARLAAEIEVLREEISAAEETRALSLASERDELMARGEELSDEPSLGSADPWLSLAQAELYLDAGEGTKAAQLSEETSRAVVPGAEAEALYGLAHAYASAGDEEKTAQAFLRLAAEYADSPRRGEACFWLGEYLTSQLEPEEAEGYYLIAAENDPQYRDAALYRAAWGYYECSSPFGTLYYDRAVPAFERFLDAAEEGSPYWDHAIEMAGVCLAEWEPGAVDRPAPLDALSRYEEVFGGTVDRAHSVAVLRALGEAYQYKMGKFPEAAAAYERLLGKYPYYGDALGVIDSLVRCHLLQDAYDDAHAARVRLVDEYGPASSWYRAQAEAGRCRALLSWENALYEVAVYYNMRAERKIRTHPEEGQILFENAINRYNQYLASFPTNERSYHINFYLAECYYSVEAYETAAEQYIKTATHYTDRERYRIDRWDEKFTQEQSFFNAIVAYDEIFQKEVEEKETAGVAPTSPRQITPRPLTETELNLAEGCIEFLARYPESKERPSILSKTGEVYSNARDFDNARRSYSELIEKYADPDDEIFYSEKLHGWFYVGALISMARTFQLEADVLSKTGESDAAEKRAEYEAWLERAKAEAEKRNVDLEDIMEDLE